MTFNHIEIPTATDNLNRSTWLIYDGPNIAVIHDGVNRYMYLKNIKTAVKFKEPNATFTGGATAFIIGSNLSTLFILNPSTKQLRTIATSGVNINEKVINLNDFNKYKDLQYTSNITQNTFVPTCGHVNQDTVVIGGYLQTISSGLSIQSEQGPATIGANTICYMYSTNGGSTFNGPFFPFINQDPQTLFTGICTNILFINDNWVFYNTVDLGSSIGSNLFFVQTLGVDFIGDNIFDPYLDTPSADINVMSLPMVYFDKKIYFQNTLKTGYWVYNYIDDTHAFTALANISAFTIVGNELRITTGADCTPLIIPAENEAGAVTITSFNLGASDFTIDVGLGATLVEEGAENADHPMFDNEVGNFNSDHTLHPATIKFDIVI